MPTRKAKRLAKALTLLSEDRLIPPDYHPTLADASHELLHMDQLLNTPSTKDFLHSVNLEAAHQTQRYPPEHDANKTPEDWREVAEHLTEKIVLALQSGDTDKALHHTISTAALMAHWHQHITQSAIETHPPKPGAYDVL